MYNEAGKWECLTEDDCFECPYSDCVKTKGHLKKMRRAKSVKREKIAPMLELTVFNTKTNETMVIVGLGKATKILHSHSTTIHRCIKNGSLLKHTFKLTAKSVKSNRVNHGIWMMVTDMETNETMKFKSKSEMARHLGATPMRINWFLAKRPDVNALFDGRYKIEVGEMHSYEEA